MTGSLLIALPSGLASAAPAAEASAVPVGLWLLVGVLVVLVLGMAWALWWRRPIPDRAGVRQPVPAPVPAPPEAAPTSTAAPAEAVPTPAASGSAAALAEALMREVLERAPVGVLLVSGSTQVLRFANARATAAMGTSAAAIEGRCLPEVLAGATLFDETGALLPAERWPLARALLRNEVTVQENVCLALGERQLWLKCSAIPLSCGIGGEPAAVFLSQDISREREMGALFQRLNEELHRKSQGLERAERLLNGALAQAPLIVMIINVPELTVRLLNDYGKRYFGLGDAEYETDLRGRLLHDLGTCPLRRPNGASLDWDALPPVRAGLEGDLVEAEDLLFTAGDGTEHRLSCSAAPIRDERGEIVAAIALATDITLQRAAEEQRRALLARVKDSERLEAMGVLAGGIAHDFNNLLATIVGHNDLAQSLLEPEHPIQPDLAAIAAASERAAEIVKRMLTMSGSNVSMRTEVDLAQLVNEEVQAQRPALPPNVYLIVDLAPGLPLLLGDRSALRQLVASLLGNALEVLTDRAGEVLVALRQRHLDQLPRGVLIEGDFRPGAWIEFSIADDGTGLSEDALARVFEPFGSMSLQGRSLGLAAVRGTVRAHRAVLSVRTAPNEGLHATVLFPA